jgi:hypothetical protein
MSVECADPDPAAGGPDTRHRGGAATTIAVTRQTHARLKDERSFLLRSHIEGRITLPNEGVGFSLDALVNRLLDVAVAYRRRENANSHRRQERG